MTVDLNIFDLGKQPSDSSNKPINVNLIQGLPNEHFEDERNIDCINQNFKEFFVEEIMLLA